MSTGCAQPEFKLESNGEMKSVLPGAFDSVRVVAYKGLRWKQGGNKEGGTGGDITYELETEEYTRLSCQEPVKPRQG